MFILSFFTYLIHTANLSLGDIHFWNLVRFFTSYGLILSSKYKSILYSSEKCLFIVWDPCRVWRIHLQIFFLTMLGFTPHLLFLLFAFSSSSATIIAVNSSNVKFVITTVFHYKLCVCVIVCHHNCYYVSRPLLPHYSLNTNPLLIFFLHARKNHAGYENKGTQIWV